MANYSAAIFANEGGLSVGNGTNYTYHIFKFNDASRYHLAAFDISGKNSLVGRLDGKNQTITKNGGFESVTFTPMIGGGDGANNPGNIGIITGIFEVTSAGISAAIIFGFLGALVFKPKG